MTIIVWLNIKTRNYNTITCNLNNIININAHRRQIRLELCTNVLLGMKSSLTLITLVTLQLILLGNTLKLLRLLLMLLVKSFNSFLKPSLLPYLFKNKKVDGSLQLNTEQYSSSGRDLWNSGSSHHVHTYRLVLFFLFCDNRGNTFPKIWVILIIDQYLSIMFRIMMLALSDSSAFLLLSWDLMFGALLRIVLLWSLRLIHSVVHWILGMLYQCRLSQNWRRGLGLRSYNFLIRFLLSHCTDYFCLFLSSHHLIVLSE